MHPAYILRQSRDLADPHKGRVLMAIDQARRHGTATTIDQYRVSRACSGGGQPRDALPFDNNIATGLHRKRRTVKVTQIRQDSRTAGRLCAQFLRRKSEPGKHAKNRSRPTQ